VSGGNELELDGEDLVTDREDTSLTSVVADDVVEEDVDDEDEDDDDEDEDDEDDELDELVAETQTAILKKIAVLLEKGDAEGVLDLAEAYAWLEEPDSDHGG